MAGTRYGFVDIAQGRPEQDRREQEARIEQIRQGTMQQRQLNEERELNLRARRKRAEEGGEDDKKIQLEGLDLDFKIIQKEREARRQPGKERVLDAEQRGVEMDSVMREAAIVYGGYTKGFKPQALEMLSASEGLGKGIAFEDLSVEDATDDSGKTVKDAKGKPVKMFVMTPKDKQIKPFKFPVADMERNRQQFGAQYVNRPDGMYRVGADGVPQKLIHTPKTDASELGYHDVNRPPPAAMGTGISPRRAAAAQKDEDDRVKTLEGSVRFYLTGSRDPFAGMDSATLAKNQANYDRIMSRAAPKVRAGVHPEQALNEVNAEFSREQNVQKKAPPSGQSGSGLKPSDAARIIFGERKGYDEGGMVGGETGAGEDFGMTGDESEKKKRNQAEFNPYPGMFPYMIPDAMPMREIPRVVQYAKGGMVSGPGGKDNVPAVVDGKKPVALTSGEGVLNKAAVAIVGEDFVNRLNQAALNISRPVRR